MPNFQHSPGTRDHGILHVNCIQQGKGLENLSDNGLRQPIHIDSNSQLEDNVLFSPHLLVILWFLMRNVI